MSAGIFEAIGKAKTFQSGSYFEPGDYELTLVDYAINDGHKGSRGVAEFVVDASTPSETGPDGKLKATAPVGAKRSAVFVLDGEHKNVGMGNMKSLTLACVVPATEAVSDADAGETMAAVLGDALRKDGRRNASEKQPLRGKRLKLRAFTAAKPTKKGVIITNLNFSFVPQTPEEIAARRAEVDKLGL